MSRRGRRFWIVLVLLALACGHVAWWYWPRERAAAPDPASAAVRLLAAGDYEVCAWVPYPHQNLGALARAAGDFPAALAAATRLAGSSAPEEMRTFGPFLVPPARELVACADLAGGRLRVAARVYPGLALVARLAGRLADNAWLAGGEVGRLRVEWRDGLWIVSAEGKGGGGRAARAEGGAGESGSAAARGVLRDLPAGLALVRLAREVRELPAGTYVLRREQADLDLVLLAPGGPAAAIPDLGPDPRPALLVAARPVASAAASPPAALALFADSEGRGNGGARPDRAANQPRAASLDLRTQLPGIALFHPAGAPVRWGMPGGALGRLLNGALPRQEAAGWSILALDEGALRQAVALAPRLSALMPPASPAAPAGRVRGAGPVPGAGPAAATPNGSSASTTLSLALWIEPRAALAVVSRVRRFLDAFPFAPRQQVRRWRDWETVLQPLASCRHGAVAASALDPPFFHLRLEGCAASESARAVE